ncbi:MAG: DUF4091 domain-containing protein [Clostridia bacterium]|nr:DUF4091 domain-containing protein [Clostridia bacterium]
MRKHVFLILLLVFLFSTVILAACTGGQSDTIETTDHTTSEPSAEETTQVPEEQSTASDTTITETQTEPPTDTPEDSPSISFDMDPDNADKLLRAFSGANATEATLETGEDGHTYIKLTATAPSQDPNIMFSYSRFRRTFSTEAIELTQTPYVIMRIKCENGLEGGSFDLFFATKSSSGIDGAKVYSATFDTGESDWQYILFDFSDNPLWTGTLETLRLDWSSGTSAAGQALCISDIHFVTTDEEYYKGFSIDWDAIGIPVDQAAKDQAAALLSDLKMPATAYDTYTPLTAEHEDSALHVWFDHLFDRTAQNDNTSLSLDTYQIRLAKNEIEGCQVILAADKDVQNVKIYVSDFTNANGDIMKTEVLWGYYFDVEGQMLIDPLPRVDYTPDPDMQAWLNGGNSTGKIFEDLQKYDGFDIAAGQNQSFVIKAHSTKDTPAGEYSATVTFTDESGNEIKKATVFAYVWNFELSDATACKTLMDLSSYSIYASYIDYAGILTDENGRSLYRAYYDYMLENRICGYSLPFDNEDGTFSAEGIVEYLDNPRVTAFQALGWKTDLNATNVSNAYAFLSQKQEWLDKAYFYPVDEPADKDMLDRIVSNADLLKQHFPGYKLIAPMHVNYNIANGDYISYLQDSVTAWCMHTYFFTTFAEWYGNRNLTYDTSMVLESKLGPIRERMKQEQAGGDEVWWYVTAYPIEPEIATVINTETVNCRTLFWQQKLYGVDHYLYYSVCDWSHLNSGLDGKREIWGDNITVYGNGVLLYSGINFAQPEPVGSLRLEAVRDGIEDFEYLTMLEKIYGTEVVNGMISTWTTGLGVYSTDEEQFDALRTQLGLLLEQNANQ